MRAVDSDNLRPAIDGRRYAKTPMRRALIVTSSVVLLAGAGGHDAVEKVREGISFFREGQFDKSAQAFADADVSRPDDPAIQFDRACAAVALGDVEKAEDFYLKAAIGKGGAMTASAYFNLGCLSADQAKAALGEDPAAATPDVRTQSLSLLVSAVRHYRECLDVEPDHADARHNLETIRLWMKHIQSVWEERDREKSREEMNLLQFLKMIVEQQRTIRSATRAIAGNAPSPRQRQAAGEIADRQQKLAEEIRPLNEKLEAELTPQDDGNAATPAPNDSQMQEAIAQLKQFAVEARDRMVAAIDHIDQGELVEAADEQHQALDRLNRIYTAIAPFQDLLQSALGLQQPLTDDSHAAADASADADEPRPFEFSENAWKQRRVAEWTGSLAQQAESQVPQLEQQAGSAGQADPNSEQAQAAEQLQSLIKSMQKAMELAPEAVEKANQAADALDNEQLADAVPDQDRVLEILREISEPLPKQQPQDQQQDNQQQDNDQSDQQEQQRDPGQSEQNEQQDQQRDMSRQQAESVLRRARERERKHREMEKQLKRAYGSRISVDRDW